MKITIAAIGSRGDVQPYIALGAGLQRAGHDVFLSAPAMFRDLVASYQLKHLPVSVNPQQIMEHPSMQAAAKSGNPIRLMRSMFREGLPLIRRYLEEVYENCRECDAVILTQIPFGAFDAAEKRNIPFLQAGLGPVYPTAAFPMNGVNLPNENIGFVNRLSYGLVEQGLWQFFRSFQNTWRKETLGLPPLPWDGPGARIRNRAPTVLGYSPSVVPTPADWPANVQATGYWFLNEPHGWQPPDALTAFLDSGPAPIYVGFGSMPDSEARKTTHIIVDALRISGQRGVLLSRSSRLGGADLPKTMCLVDSIPHSWLFPCMAAVVHHGGAGTTGAGLRSGVPSILTPYGADQFFWAQRVEALGVGPKTVSYHKLTAETLARMIRQAVTDQSMREQAAAFGRRIESEHGVEKAVEFITGFLVGKK
ncbi:MAG: glycosyltransferase family 1 protein [Anaerolineales bacterium]|nr:glycosyltransferase family 1 protein [Anaerolineales bacterium]